MTENHPSHDEILAWLDGALASEDARRMETHVHECQECQSRLETIDTQGHFEQEVRSAIHHSPDVDARILGVQKLLEQVDLHTSDSSARGLPRGSESSASEVSSDIFRTGAILGQYQLMGKLGQGGMGTVYRALHLKLNKEVALKVLTHQRLKNKDFIDRFEREMRVVGKLQHRNIVRAMDAGEIDGTHFLVMEIVDGVDLAVVLENYGPLAVADACELIRQAAVGLDEAHHHGMVHRDIKPPNLMLARNRVGQPHVTLLDMGLALLSDTNDELTASGQVVGTIDYMSPEQCNNSHSVDIRTDIYSLGATLYKLLSGKAPFASEEPTSVVQKLIAIATKMPPTISEFRDDLPPDLILLIGSLLAKQPDDRPATPAELIQRIEPFTSGFDLRPLLTTNPEFSTAQIAPTEVIGWDSPTANQDTWHTRVNHSENSPHSKTASMAAPENATGSKQHHASTWRRLIGAGLAIALAAVAATAFLFPTRDDGSIQFEFTDPGIKVVFGEETATIDNIAAEHHVAPGRQKLNVLRENVNFDAYEFSLDQGEKTRIRLTYLKRKIVVDHDGRLHPLLPIQPPTEAPQDPSANGQIVDTSVSISELLTSPDYKWTEPVRVPFPDGHQPHASSGVSGYGTWQSVYFNGQLSTKNQKDICVVERSADGRTWGIPKALPEPISGKAFFEGGCSVTNDGLVMVFDSIRPGGLDRRDLWIAERKSTQDPFGKPVNLGKPINTDRDDRSPAISGDGLTLVWSSPHTPPGQKAEFALRIASRKNRTDPFENPKWVSFDDVPKTQGDGPWLSPDGNTLLFVDKSGAGFGFALSTRNSPADPFGPAIRFGYDLPGFGRRLQPSLSPDKQWFYFSSNQEGQTDSLWMCQRVRKGSSANVGAGESVDTALAVSAEVLPPTQKNSDAATLGYALQLRGREGYVQLPIPAYDFNTREMTIEGIINPQDSLDIKGEGHAGRAIVIGNDKERLDLSFLYGCWRSQFRVAPMSLYTMGSTDIRIADINGPNKFRRLEPMHLAAVYSGGEVTLLLDGELVTQEGLAIEYIYSGLKTGATLGVERNSNGGFSEDFYGTIREVRFSTIARYKASYTPKDRLESDEHTLALYHFDEGSGNVLKDSSGNGYDGKILGAKWVTADDLDRLEVDLPGVARQPSKGDAEEK